MRPLPLVMLLAACQEPFETDRHDLRGLRIAAIGVHDGVAAAAVWSVAGPWHEQTPTLAWTLDGASIGEGYDVPVTGDGTLGLIVTDAAGASREAAVTVSSLSPALSVSRASVEIGTDLSLDARRALEAADIERSAPSGASVRLTLAGVAEDASARWMSAAGTMLELETDAADLIPEEILFDDGEVETRTDLDDGVFPGLALSRDGAGANDWLWLDAAVGVQDEGLVRHEGRLLVADAVPEAGLIAATLVEDAVGGVMLEAVEAVSDASQQEALACMPAGAETFSVAWVADGRCARPDVLGARVVLETW